MGLHQWNSVKRFMYVVLLFVRTPANPGRGDLKTFSRQMSAKQSKWQCYTVRAELGMADRQSDVGHVPTKYAAGGSRHIDLAFCGAGGDSMFWLLQNQRLAGRYPTFY